MSPIAGVITKDGTDAISQVVRMVETMRPDATATHAVVNGNPKRMLQDAGRGEALGQVSFLAGAETPEQPYFNSSGIRGLLYDGQLYNFELLATGIQDSPGHVEDSNSQLVACLLGEHQGALVERIRSVLEVLDGGYVLAVKGTRHTVIARDSLGTRPLYCGHNHNFSAFASNKKPLWQMGVDNVIPLRAGMMAAINEGGIEVGKALPLSQGEPKITDLSTAVECYRDALLSAVEKRLGDVDEVGVLLSGGVDSCLIAGVINDLAVDHGIKLVAYTAGVSDSEDIGWAQDFAQQIGLECRVKELTHADVEAYIPEVIQTVEERDFVQVEAGIGIYAAVEMAAHDGIEVLFSGQGADELWGGYEWYPEVLRKEGYPALCQKMWDDLSRADIETLDRENKIAMANGVETRFPYLDLEVVKVALNTAPELKVDISNRFGKIVHRLLASKLGISEEYAYRDKNAAQHGTGIHDVLKQTAVTNGFDAPLVEHLGYSDDKITSERLGSSSRYGWRYAGGSLWQVPQPVQLFLDVMAYEQGLLNETERRRIRQFIEKLES